MPKNKNTKTFFLIRNLQQCFLAAEAEAKMNLSLKTVALTNFHQYDCLLFIKRIHMPILRNQLKEKLINLGKDRKNDSDQDKDPDKDKHKNKEKGKG